MVAMAVKGGAGSEPDKRPNFAAALQLSTMAGNLHSANLLHQEFAALKNLPDFNGEQSLGIKRRPTI